jgi:hypothetical protein
MTKVVLFFSPRLDLGLGRSLMDKLKKLEREPRDSIPVLLQLYDSELLVCPDTTPDAATKAALKAFDSDPNARVVLLQHNGTGAEVRNTQFNAVPKGPRTSRFFYSRDDLDPTYAQLLKLLDNAPIAGILDRIRQPWKQQAELLSTLRHRLLHLFLPAKVHAEIEPHQQKTAVRQEFERAVLLATQLLAPPYKDKALATALATPTNVAVIEQTQAHLLTGLALTSLPNTANRELIEWFTTFEQTLRALTVIGPGEGSSRTSGEPARRHV